ncbi:MAG: hypothetical protein Rubg2KO_35920 [Rubricoccaceae bacterium]
MRLLVFSLLLAGAASAQEVTLYPGHPDLNTSALTPTDVTRDIRMVEPEPQSLGISVETATLDGDVLTIVSRSGPDGSQLDSTRVSWPSLAPLSQNTAAGTNQGSAMFSGMEVSGSFGSADDPQAFELAVPSVPFPSSVLRYIVRALPLDQTGYEATAPVFSPQSRLKDIYLTVEGPETVTLPNGTTVDAVAVSAVGGPGGPQKHFVDASTRTIVQSEAQAQGMLIRATPVTEEELAAILAQNEADAAAAEAARAEAEANAITPGSDALVAVEPQTVTMTVRLIQPQEQDLGTVTVTEILAGGQLTLTSDVQIPAAGQNQQDTTVVAYPSLMPISRVEVTPNEVERATFADGQMTGTVTAGDEVTNVEAALDGAFGPGITNHLIRMLPFAEGYVTSFRQINGDGDISLSQLSVTGQESYTTPSGSERTVWVIVEEEDGNPDYTYYVDAETRELLRTAFSPQPGVTLDIVVP